MLRRGSLLAWGRVLAWGPVLTWVRVLSSARALAVVLMASMVTACGDGPADTPPPVPIGGTAAERTAVRFALDDIVERVIPALGDASATQALRTPVASLATAVASRDRGAATERLAAARSALDAFRRDGDQDQSRVADIDAVAIALAQVDWLLTLPQPGSGN